MKKMIDINIWEINDKELLNLIVGRDGGRTTVKIIDKILTRPYTRNQLSTILHLDYNTITYHVEIIYKHKYITKEKLGNVFYYHPSDKLFNSMEEYNLLKNFLKIMD